MGGWTESGFGDFECSLLHWQCVVQSLKNVRRLGEVVQPGAAVGVVGAEGGLCDFWRPLAHQ
jgi:hypothetical protein